MPLGGVRLSKKAGMNFRPSLEDAYRSERV